MAAIMMKKAFKDYDINSIITFANYTPTLDKFILKAFN